MRPPGCRWSAVSNIVIEPKKVLPDNSAGGYGPHDVGRQRAIFPAQMHTAHLEIPRRGDHSRSCPVRYCHCAVLIKAVQAGKLHRGKLVTHRFALNDILKAHDTFGDAAKHAALKVALKAELSCL